MLSKRRPASSLRLGTRRPPAPRVITSDKRVLCQPCALILLDFFDTLQPPPKTPGNRPLQAPQLAAPMAETLTSTPRPASHDPWYKIATAGKDHTDNTRRWNGYMRHLIGEEKAANLKRGDGTPIVLPTLSSDEIRSIEPHLPFPPRVLPSMLSLSGLLFADAVNFQGFYFPFSVAFRGSRFEGEVSFRGSIFEGNADFKKSTFGGNRRLRRQHLRGRRHLHGKHLRGNRRLRRQHLRGRRHLHGKHLRGNRRLRGKHLRGQHLRGNRRLRGQHLRGNRRLRRQHLRGNR